MKAAERLARYGAKAYAKMRGIKGKPALKEILRVKRLYPTTHVDLSPKAPYISRTQRSYWADVKSLAKERDMSIKDTRTLLKKLKTSKNVQVRVIKSGEGWQLVMKGLYIHNREETEEGFIILEPPYEEEIETGHSYVHKDKDYDECFEECERDALNSLGRSISGDGYQNIEYSEWKLKRVIKETWLRYFGRKE